MTMACIRIGEASHPGPSEATEHPFFLGTFNPSGLRNKAQFVSSHLSFGDIWSVSETHLSRSDLVDFRKGLHFADSPLKYCIGGSPVTHAHAWKGVAVISQHPTRALPHEWPTEIANSSRALVTTTLLDDVWVHVGTVYGEPDAHLYPNHKRNNDLLIHHVASRICHLMNGPRMVAGDFNEEMGTLDAFHTLRQEGFVDLQELAWQRWGVEPKYTCKGKTRKDFCFISAELQDLLTKVSVMDDVFPDHSIVVGHFRRMRHRVPKMVWPSPKQFPWPTNFEVQPDVWSSSAGSCGERYANLWRHIETAAAARVPFRVAKCMMGRAATQHPRPVWEGKFAPIRVGRPGDFQPHFLGASVRQAQWVRQSRRLQAYVRFTTKHASDAPSPYGVKVWGAVLRGKGFKPSFADWWKESQYKTAGAPQVLPCVPPPAALAQEIFDSMAMAVRALESTLISESRSYARQRREVNPCLIFKDLKQPGHDGAALLAKSIRATINHVCAEDCCITFDEPVEWQLSKPVFSGGKQLSIIHADHDCMWLETVDFLEPGMPVVQTLCSGSVPELHDAFVNTWRARWLRHLDVPLARWQAILSFARSHLPKGGFTWAPCGVTELKNAIKNKRATTSCGLDGVSVSDLKHMPVCALHNFCAIFAEAESTGHWPPQMINGRVACLPKIADPKTALDFRPITILGLLYRCWGSYHAKQALRAIDGALPPTLFGSRPGCFASQVWAQLMWSIEHSYAQDIELCGIVADVQKAFNFLARPVVTEILAWVGIPMQVLVGWTGAVQTFTRRFQVRGSLSEPVLSVTGYPEGDALSCLAMVAVDWVFHAWTLHFFPLCQPITYVDDWQLLCCQPAALAQLQAVLQDFADQVDLILDLRKTYAWCISARGRALLRARGFKLEANGRNLGAHVQFTRSHANQVLTDRITAVADLWSRLRRSHSAYEFKATAIRVAAWPRALHAVSATALGHSWFQQLRSGAMKGLGVDFAGANSHIHLGMVEIPETDPQFWAIMQTFRLVRDCGNHKEVRHNLAALAHGQIRLPNNGITTTLMERIQALGWHISPLGCISDHFGVFSLFNTSLAEIKLRAGFAWTRVVAEAVGHRPGFQQLHLADPVQTRRWLKGLNTTDRALMHKALNGTHISQDGLKYCQQASSDLCQFCGSSDSRFHRFWVCPYFQDFRAACSADVWALIPKLPSFLTEYGWSLQAATKRQWYEMLNAIAPHPLPGTQPKGQFLQLFTDGSCIHQSFAEYRFAAWAVIVAQEDDLEAGVILDCGHLPGMLQTAYRAEIYAVLRAVRAARKFNCAAMIWSDCEGVVKRVRRLLQGHLPRVNSPNFDLWSQIAQEFADMFPNQFAITHVSAHRGDSALSPLEDWCFQHNQWADRTAVRMNFTRTDSFWHLFQQHVSQVRAAIDISRQVQDVILAVSQAAVRSQRVDSDSEPDDTVMPFASQFWHGVQAPDHFPPDVFRWYPEKLVRLIFSWFLQNVHASAHDVIWVSHMQLYVAFQMATGSFGPIKKGVWADGDDNCLSDIAGFPFRTRVRWFAKVLKETLRKCSISVKHFFGRPCSNVLKLHTGLLALPWPPAQVAAVDRWFLKHCPLGIRRVASSVDRLPCAALDPEFDAVYITSM